MKRYFRIIPVLAIISFSYPAFSLEVFNHPTVKIEGVDYKIIDEDTWDDDWYDDSATGFCRLQGFEKSYQTSAIKGWYGPYAALDEEGRVMATFPDEGNADRFYELVQIICE